MSSHLPDGTRLAYGTATAAYQVEGVDDRRRPRPLDLGHVHGAARAPSRTAATARWPALLPAARRGPRPAGRPGRRLLPLLGRLAAGAARPAPARSSRAGWPTTTGWSTGARARRRSRWRRSTTGTCRSRSRTRGGWPERATAEAFADYATIVHDRLGDRVQRLGHPQRAVVRGVPRLRRRRARAGPARAGGRAPRRPPPAPRPRAGRGPAARGRRRRPSASCST